MRPTQPISLEEFRVRAAQTGLPLTEADLRALHEGYVGLRQLMARLPDDWALAAEPPAAFRPLTDETP